MVRACHEIAREHSHCGFCNPRTDPGADSHIDLIEAARRDILTKLQVLVTAAERVACDIEVDRKWPEGVTSLSTSSRP
ncbi:hypothetical protein SXIM_19960 [Streptomyces xiamenensis]|uniref:Uncharacterized protein n=1 Tax=Streptomyces xiamenensis TaxID=408015 RepID=A0A0F7FT47_9ACTN|nr:hypothetical protein SXIM_19960 [Streptomyces xiamenensis]